MKRIATLFLAIVMLVSVMAPASVFAATAYTTPATTVAVNKYTSANPFSTVTVPEDETWVFITPKGMANTDTLTVGEEGWTSPDGMVSLSPNSKWKVTVADERDGLLQLDETAANHFYTNDSTYGPNSTYFIIHPDKVGIKGDFTLKLGINRFAKSGQNVGFEVKTDSMAEPYSSEFASGATSGTTSWVNLTSQTFTFAGTDDEYVKIFNPSIATGSLRFFGVSFVESEAINPEEETVTTPTFTDDAAWTNTAGVYSTTANNNSATFTAKNLGNAYYDVFYDLALTGTEATAPAVEFKVKDASSNDVATYVYNTGDGYLSSGKLYLGTYLLSGASSVSVTKLGGTAELKASAVYFEPNFTANTKVTLTRETAKYKVVPSVTNDGSAIDDSEEKMNYLNFLGNPAYRTDVAGKYQGYCTRDYNMSDNAPLTSGYYDVWTYAIVDADTKAADDVKAYVYHNGLASGPVDLNYGDYEVGTRKWIKIDTYYFKGGYANEYVSIGSDTARIRLGGVKFIPNDTYANTLGTETIILANDASKVTASPAFSTWSTSGSVKYPGTTTASYYKAALGATVTFSAKGLAQGTYDVYYWHAPYYRAPDSTSTPDSDSIQFIVKHKGITDAQHYNGMEGANEEQTKAGAWTWKHMGTYDFQGGSDDEHVTLFNRTSKPMRATAVKFVKKETERAFVVPAYKITGLNVTTSNTVSASDAETVIHEGLIPNIIHPGVDEQTITITLPQHGSKTAAGTYRVSVLGAKHAYWAGEKLYATVVDKTGEPVEKEITIVNGEWLPIDDFEFTNDTAAEYVKFTFPSTASGGLATGFAAVKFELIAEASAGEEAPELSETIDVNVEYGSEDLTSIVLKPHYEEISEGVYADEQSKNPDGTLRYYEVALPVIVSVTNGKADTYEKEVVVYGAVYDEDNNLIVAKKFKGGSDTILSGKSAEFYDYFVRQFQPGDKVVTYIWDTELTPISVQYPITAELPVE